MTRTEVLNDAILKCMQALYEQAQPKVTWDDFVKQNNEYKEGPKPYEFYYLDSETLKEIVSEYSFAYRIDPEYKDCMDALEKFFDDPIRKIESEYEHFTPLKEIIGEDNYSKVLKYIEESSNFYRWDSDRNYFNFNIYLGAAPSSNKEAVINNWKVYKNKDIEINGCD